MAHFCFFIKVYAKVAGVPESSLSTLDVSSEVFYGKGYDDSDRRIPDMTIITKQLGILSLILLYLCIVWNQSEFKEITVAP